MTETEYVLASLEFNGKGMVHLYGPFTASIVGVTLQNQMALSFPDHAPTL